MSQQITSPASDAVQNGLRTGDSQRLKKACKDMESLFINMMLKEMRKSIPKSGLFEDSLERDIYTSMFDQQIAEEASGVGRGIGLADMLYENLSRQG